jgi:integrase
MCVDEEQAKIVGELQGWLRSLVEFNLQTGARRGDLLQLTWESVHPSYVEFARTKECRHRKIPLNDRAKAILDFLRPDSPTPDEFVFEPNVPRETIISRIRRERNRAVKKAAVPKIRYHDLRHTTATRLIRSDVDVRTVQDLLGHAKLSTTERYLHTNDKLKQQAVAKLGEERASLALRPGITDCRNDRNR